MIPASRVLLAIALVAALAAGCNTLGRQPRLTDAEIEPDVVAPGDVAVLSVEVKDKYDLVEDVKCAILDQYGKSLFEFELVDDGTPPDVEAGDDVWTRMLESPFTAPAGQYTLRLTAYDAQGRPILVKTKEGTRTLSTQLGVTVEYPPMPPGAPELPPDPAADDATAGEAPE